jgi:hypothetical protein
MDTDNTVVPPLIPSLPKGPRNGRVSSVYRFTTSSQDPLGRGVKCRFHWGDGTMSDWTVSVPDDIPHTMTHAWTRPGRFEVRAQAKNTAGVQSAWSPALRVTIEGSGQGAGSGTDVGDAD